MKEQKEQFECEGKWLLPFCSGESFSGSLKYAPAEGAELKIRDFENRLKDSGEFHKEIGMITGRSIQGETITLAKGFYRGSRRYLNKNERGGEYDFLFDDLFVGGHIEKKEDLKFKVISTDFHYLGEWLGISGFQSESLVENKLDALIKFSVPKEIITTLSDGYKITIGFGYEVMDPLCGGTEAHVRQTSAIIIEAPSPVNYEMLKTKLYQMQNFLSLAISHSVHFLKVKAYIDYPQNELRVFFYKGSLFQETLPDISLFNNSLIIYKDIADKWPIILENWFSKSEKMKSMHDLYFGALYNPRIYLRHFFLNMIQALEVYYRTYLNNANKRPVVEEQKIEEVLSSVDEKHRDWLSDKLTPRTDPDLRRQMSDIFDKYMTCLKKIIPWKDAFIDKVVNTRNYFTHNDSKKQKKTAQGEELYQVTDRLKKMIELCFLTELGFDYSEIEALIKRKGSRWAECGL